MIYILIVIGFVLLSIGIYLNFQCKIFYPSSKKLRILEYHSVSTDGFEDQITISKEKFIEQLDYLKANNYTTIWFSDLDNYLNFNTKLPKKTVILTFDDGFPDNYTQVLPLLKQYDFKAVCFMVLGRIGKDIDWPGRFIKPNTTLINKAQMLEMSSNFEFGYHTFKHDNYTKLTFDEIEEDLKRCQEVIKNENLNVYPALAYTFGRYFRKKDKKQTQFFSILEKYGIKYGLRIGNRINTLPVKSKFEIQRIDIRGYENMKTFRKRMLIGRDSFF